MNDRELDVVARNTILLLFALVSQDTPFEKEVDTLNDIAEVIIHLWYSASIPSSVLSRLQDSVRPLIADVCSQIASKAAKSVLGKTWKFSGDRTLRLVLVKEAWPRLLSFLENPKSRTLEDTTRIRAAVTLQPERADYRDRWLYKEASPFMRIARQRFWDDGLLLPFGSQRLTFETPNP
jgi:hypothetical protein